VALVTGDDVVCAESTELLGPGLRTLPVKQGLGRFAARHVAPARAKRLIAEAAAEAVTARAGAPVYTPGAPCTIEVELGAPDHAHGYRHRTGVELTGPRTVVSTGDSWWTAWRQLYL
jgi:D-amino peptidase